MQGRNTVRIGFKKKYSKDAVVGGNLYEQLPVNGEPASAGPLAPSVLTPGTLYLDSLHGELRPQLFPVSKEMTTSLTITLKSSHY